MLCSSIKNLKVATTEIRVSTPATDFVIIMVLSENIIENHDFSNGLENWIITSNYGFVVSGPSDSSDCRPEICPMSGDSYVVVKNRTQTYHGLEQEITNKLSPGSLYKLSTWVQISSINEGYAPVEATLRLEFNDSPTDYLSIAVIRIKNGEWENLEGTFSLSPIPKGVFFYLEGPDPGINLLVDSVVAYEIPRSAPVGDGNTVMNSAFEDGLNNWRGRNCEIQLHNQSNGNGEILPFTGHAFASATERRDKCSGIQHDITAKVQHRLAYEVIAVVRINGSNVTDAKVRVILQVLEKNLHNYEERITKSQVSKNEWTKLEGVFLLKDAPSTAVIHLDGPPPGIDILVDSVTVRPAQECSLLPLPNYEAVNNSVQAATFGSNIIDNCYFYDGKRMWLKHDYCELEVRTGSPRIVPPMARDTHQSHISILSCNYLFVTSRAQRLSGPAQNISSKLKLYLTYQVSAWVRLGFGVTSPQDVIVTLELDGRKVHTCQVEATDSRWHEIGGSFRMEKEASEVKVYVHGPSSGVDFMLAGLQIFPVDRKARFEHLKQKAEKIRMRDVVLKFHGTETSKLQGKCIKVRQKKNTFPLGSSISKADMGNKDYVNFFVENFNWAVFGNELKWSCTEPHKGEFDYEDADQLLRFCEGEDIKTRGHCIFEEVEHKNQQWVRSLNDADLETAIDDRLKGLLNHFKGKFRHYDVDNEMMHGSFYRDRLGGKDIRSYMFKKAQELDTSATLFVNDYHVEDGCDARSSPEKYIEHIHDLQEQGAPIGGIGIQAHIDSPVGAIVCCALDKLSKLGLPIWFTELDVASISENVRAEDLEVMLREGFAHPAVDGIILSQSSQLLMNRSDDSTFEHPKFVINQVGKKYVDLREEWLTRCDGVINDEGEFAFRGFYGTYIVEIDGFQERVSKEFDVEKSSQLKVDVIL